MAIKRLTNWPICTSLNRPRGTQETTLTARRSRWSWPKTDRINFEVFNPFEPRLPGYDTITTAARTDLVPNRTNVLRVSTRII